VLCRLPRRHVWWIALPEKIGGSKRGAIGFELREGALGLPRSNERAYLLYRLSALQREGAGIAAKEILRRADI